MKTKICAVYGRESVLDDSVEHGSIEQQRYMGISQAEMLSSSTGIRHQIEHFLIEETGVSGKNNNRPKYQELLKLVRSKKIDVVFAKEISRLNRSVQDFCSFMALCEEKSVAVKIKGLEVDPSTPMGKAMFQILAVVAQLERELCCERVRGTLRSAAINNKKINGGPIILGFDRDPAKKGFWNPNREELNKVEFLMTTFSETLSFVETIKAANAKGIVNKTGTRFQKNSIRSLLTNQKYIGKMVVKADGKDHIVELPFGKVIPELLFEKVQNSIHTMEQRFQRSNRNDRRAYPLSGLLKFEDGSKFTVTSGTSKSGETYLYYRNKKNSCTVDALEIEKAVIRGMRFYEKSDRLIEQVSKIEHTKGQHEQLLRSQLLEIEKKMKQVANRETDLANNFSKMSGDSKRVSDWLDNQLREIELEKTRLASIMDSLHRDISTLKLESVDARSLKSSLKSLFDRLEKANSQTQRGIFRQVFKEVVVCKDNTIRISWLAPSVNLSGSDLVAREKWLRTEDSAPKSVPPVELFETIPFNSRPAYLDEEFLKRKYVDQKLSASQIATEICSARSTVIRYLKLYRIPLRKGLEARRLNSGQISFGQRKRMGMNHLNSTEQRAMKQMIALREQGLSYRNIAKVLTSLGVKTKNPGSRWHPTTIMKILNRCSPLDLEREREAIKIDS